MLALFGLLLSLQVTAVDVQSIGADVFEVGSDRDGGAAYAPVYQASVRAERENQLFLAWQAATPALRERAAGVLEGLRSVGAPSEWRPDLGSIGVLTEVLAGGDPERWLGESAAATLAVQAMAVDLVVRPGVFSPAAEGQRTVSLTVVVDQLFELREALDVTARLFWIAPDGSESLARQEPVSARAFQRGAFEMYVRAPHGPLGLWKLELELEPSFEFAEGGTRAVPVGSLLLAPVRSAPALVPCVEELAPKSVSESLLVELGLRVPPFVDGLASEWLADLAAGRETRPGAARAGDIELLWAPPSEIATGPCLAGEVGRRWREDIPARITVVQGFDPSGRSGLIHSALDQLARPGAARVLVLDGDALVGGQLEALVSGPYELDALVVIATSWRPTASLPEVPTLFLTPDGDAAALAEELGAGRIDAETLTYSTFLSSLEIPAHIRAFLERRVVGRTGGGSQ